VITGVVEHAIDPEFVAADRIRDETGYVLRYACTAMPPLPES
jgi:hypothetical protein